ncbi:MAG: 5-formyltetrahydrofolate cyclo-ligase [Chlamydiae bacterium]|nr:5-formyltetrahydrofolate cyclo-ligase [Chlamydiota bacterium]
MESKLHCRKRLLEMRHALSKERRIEGQQKLTQELHTKLQSYSLILSFASKEEEIDLWPLNAMLAKEGRLLLPRLVSKTELLAFAVTDFNRQLVIHPKWKVLEPDPDRSPLVALDHVSCVLVPGVGFDESKQRLGYGLGHYDRFLAKLNCPLFGLGFREQHCAEAFQVQSHDIPMTEVLLF